MKHYHRETKSWLTEEEIAAYKKKKRNKELCRGGKEHDYILILPSYINFTSKYNYNAERYYRILEEIDDFNEKKSKELEEMGVKDRIYSWRGSRLRTYGCSVCHKLDHREHKKAI